MSSSDHTYSELRRQILEGELEPGAPLKERNLVARMGVSRTPVREALRRLVADGLAEMQPRRSIVVSTYSETELAEIFELGSILETHVAGLAAEKATASDKASLSRILDRMETLLANRTDDLATDYARLDQQFHDAIATAARNRRIALMLRQTVSLRWLASLMQQYSEENFERSISNHRQILAAIEAGDADAARAAMAAHVGAGQQAGVGRQVARTAAAPVD